MSIEVQINEYVRSRVQDPFVFQMKVFRKPVPEEKNPCAEIFLPEYITIPLNIEGWPWPKKPLSVRLQTQRTKSVIKEKRFNVIQRVDQMIKEASVLECMTSSSAYIRSCKKWYENESR